MTFVHLLATLSLLVWAVALSLKVETMSRVKRLYQTPDHRCWSAFVASNPMLEQPANGQQNAVRPMYAVEVKCQ